MDTYFICLANSYKRGGRCIAGVEIDIDSNNHWNVKQNSNGSPKWIRPIAHATEYGEIPEDEAHLLPLLSVVRLTEVIPCPNMAHSEDVNYKQMYPIGRVPSHPIVLNKLTDAIHPVLFYTTDYPKSVFRITRLQNVSKTCQFVSLCYCPTTFLTLKKHPLKSRGLVCNFLIQL